MTTRARSANAAVIEMRRRPRTRGMTQIATRIGGDMTRRFSSCRGAVMTTRARTRHLRVIDACRWTPHTRRMARLARIRTRDMREIFSSRRGAVVTA